jgi:DNA helicase-2/ATP-dependent DNA helicase PcrA
MSSAIFDGLNEQQAAAVGAVQGPVCILAGAGSGKTTTITRRIANQVATGTFAAGQILAVTFTDKAAGEMATRLKSLGVPGVRAKTFHAEALAQYRKFSEDQSEILGSKARLIVGLAKSLPMPHKFTAVRDLATEIERAKNSRILPARYLDSLEEHRPPIPADLMHGIYSSYERRKQRANLIDFEDLLERTIEILAENSAALDEVRTKYLSFTVDEYQDVNLLQQTLLETWVGPRTDVCVVGDDYQAIFGFTGATPRYLLGFPGRHLDCQVFELGANYRSTPEIIEVANRLVPKMLGSGKELHAIGAPGSDPSDKAEQGAAPEFREFSLGSDEITWISDRLRGLHGKGIAWEEMAVLYRINARSEALEEELSGAGIPYQMRDSAFLRRPAAREVMHRLRRANNGAVADTVEKIVRDLGYRDDEVFEGEEATRQADLARLIKLANEFPGDGGIAGFIADLVQRFNPEEEGRGVQILTYHRAKGLEFEAVFLPRLEEKELPFALAKSSEDLAEERRLLYVGITRAKRYLFVSWARNRLGERFSRREPSPFLEEIYALSKSQQPTPKQNGPKAADGVATEDQELFAALRNWRLAECRKRAVPAYVVFNDETLTQIASSRPKTFTELRSVPGVGPAKLQTYGHHVLAIVREHTS